MLHFELYNENLKSILFGENKMWLVLGTWALVIVTFLLVRNTNKQMVENTRNTKEMIKENSMLVWRNSVISTVADFLGTLSYVKISHDPTKIEKIECLQNHMEFLFREKYDHLNSTVRYLTNGTIKIVTKINADGSPIDEKDLQMIEAKCLEAQEDLKDEIMKLLKNEVVLKSI
jgi:hypothetical protein